MPGTGDARVDWGWTVGGGVERAVSSRWTVKAEYGFLSFDQNLTAPASRRQTAPPGPALAATQAAPTDLSQDIHQFKVGMNYRLGPAAEASQMTPRMDRVTARGYKLTAGARYVYGWGQFHKDSASKRKVLPRSPRDSLTRIRTQTAARRSRASTRRSAS